MVSDSSANAQLPAAVWQASEMRRAWRTRDFRAVFYLACRVGLTPEIIAGNTGLPLDLVLDVMKGNTVINGDPGIADQVATGFGMPDDHRRFFGLASRSVSSASVAVPQRRAVKGEIKQRAHIGLRIAALRRERRLTQESLAERAGISRETVGKIERNSRRPSLAMLDTLAAALSVSASAIIDFPVTEVQPGRKRECTPGQLGSSSPQSEGAAENFGTELTRLMAARRVGVREIARQTGYTAGYISNLRSGVKAPSPKVAGLLDSALEADESLIEAERSVAKERIPQPRRRSEDFRIPSAPESELTFESSGYLLDVLSRIQKLHRGTVHPEIIGQLQDNIRHIVMQYESLDHSSLTPVLLKERAWIDALLDECYHPRQRQQLFDIAGAVSGVLGYVAVGRGDFPLARAYCLEAFQLGDFAEDANLQAWARGLQSFCEYYAGRYDEALNLAEDGLNYAQAGPQSVRLTINGAARAMGKLGDADGVQRAVSAAYDLMSRTDIPSGIPSSISFECYSAAQTASNAATAYVSLGMTEKVQQYVDLALPDIIKSGSPWSRSLVMIDLALSIIRSKEPDLDHAAELILDALRISAGRPIISVKQRTFEFVREATGQWGNIRQVSAVRDAASNLNARL